MELIPRRRIIVKKKKLPSIITDKRRKISYYTAKPEILKRETIHSGTLDILRESKAPFKVGDIVWVEPTQETRGKKYLEFTYLGVLTKNKKIILTHNERYHNDMQKLPKQKIIPILGVKVFHAAIAGRR